MNIRADITQLQRDTAGPAILPAVDVIEDAQGLTLYADLPGVNHDTLRIDIDGDTLTLEGQRSDLPQGQQTLYTELARRTFRRSFTLGKALDAAQVSAELSAGVLRLRIPKAPHAQVRRVPVQVN
jgi:HSP20 family protein